MDRLAGRQRNYLQCGPSFGWFAGMDSVALLVFETMSEGEEVWKWLRETVFGILQLPI